MESVYFLSLSASSLTIRGISSPKEDSDAVQPKYFLPRDELNLALVPRTMAPCGTTSLTSASVRDLTLSVLISPCSRAA